MVRDTARLVPEESTTPDPLELVRSSPTCHRAALLRGWASARPPRSPRTPATAHARAPRGRTGCLACVRKGPCHAAGGEEGASAPAAWSYYASCDSACTRAERSSRPGEQPAAQAAGSAHPYAAPPPQSHGPGRRSPPPQRAPRTMIRHAEIISPNPLNAYQFSRTHGFGLSRLTAMKFWDIPK